MTPRPNILVVLTDQLRYPPLCESDELQGFRREKLTAEDSLEMSVSTGGRP